MRSDEVFKSVISKPGVKAISSELGVSKSLVYKWCQDKDQLEASGVFNPLDRLLKITELAADDSLLAWLCQQRGGFFIPNPDSVERDVNSRLFEETQSLLKEFSDLLSAVSASHSDGNIDHTEAASIRAEWEELKSLGETFVRRCENGDFATTTEMGP